MESARDIIRAEIKHIRGRKKIAGDHIMIQCPFHADNSPSLGIYLATGMAMPIGVWHCFSCDRRGSWNELAEKIGLRSVKSWSNFETEVANIELKDSRITLKELLKSIGGRSNEWPIDMKWRGFDGQLIRDVGGMIVDDDRTKSITVFFPVFIGKRLRGGVKAAMKKEKGVLSYVTTQGKWVMRYGLFGYNLARSFQKDYVVLVEGPRDALRLLENKIPALAILGANNFSAEKALMVSTLHPKIVYVLPDNDEAGKKMRTLVKKHMSQLCETRSIALPEDVKDPEELGYEDLKLLKNILSSH